MSSATTPESTGSVHPARKQLDELDALIQRMLVLPVNRLEEELSVGNLGPVGAPPIALSGGPVFMRSATVEKEEKEERPSFAPLSPLEIIPENHSALAVVEHAPEQTPPVPVQESSIAVRLNEKSESAVLPTEIKKEDFQVPSIFRTNIHGPEKTLAQTEVPSVVQETEIAIPSVPSTQVTFWLLPLYGINRAFDWGTFLLGPPGRWLRGKNGRACLGFGGGVLVVVAVTWGVLDWMGWTW